VRYIVNSFPAWGARLGPRGNPEAMRQDGTLERCKPGRENSRRKIQKGTSEFNGTFRAEWNRPGTTEPSMEPSLPLPVRVARQAGANLETKQLF
jgi:hypothetical protein